MVEVKTGISDYDNIEILEGISDSTQVVVEALRRCQTPEGR